MVGLRIVEVARSPLGNTCIFPLGEPCRELPALGGAWSKKGLRNKSGLWYQQLATWAAWPGRPVTVEESMQEKCAWGGYGSPRPRVWGSWGGDRHVRRERPTDSRFVLVLFTVGSPVAPTVVPMNVCSVRL